MGAEFKAGINRLRQQFIQTGKAIYFVLAWPGRSLWMAFAKHWPRLSRWVARLGWPSLMLAALGIEAEHEYGIAFGCVIASAFSLVFSLFYWEGFPDSPVLTSLGRLAGTVIAILLAFFGCLWVVGQKADQRWSNIPKYFNERFRKGIVDSVIRKPSILTWEQPAPIIVGTPLSEKQLNATASVKGTYTYDPTYGFANLPVGTDILSVTFTPQDAAYSPQTKTVALLVTPSPASSKEKISLIGVNADTPNEIGQDWKLRVFVKSNTGSTFHGLLSSVSDQDIVDEEDFHKQKVPEERIWAAIQGKSHDFPVSVGDANGYYLGATASPMTERDLADISARKKALYFALILRDMSGYPVFWFCGYIDQPNSKEVKTCAAHDRPKTRPRQP